MKADWEGLEDSDGWGAEELTNEVDAGTFKEVPSSIPMKSTSSVLEEGITAVSMKDIM